MRRKKKKRKYVIEAGSWKRGALSSGEKRGENEE